MHKLTIRFLSSTLLSGRKVKDIDFLKKIKPIKFIEIIFALLLITSCTLPTLSKNSFEPEDKQQIVNQNQPSKTIEQEEIKSDHTIDNQEKSTSEKSHSDENGIARYSFLVNGKLRGDNEIYLKVGQAVRFSLAQIDEKDSIIKEMDRAVSIANHEGFSDAIKCNDIINGVLCVAVKSGEQFVKIQAEKTSETKEVTLKVSNEGISGLGLNPSVNKLTVGEEVAFQLEAFKPDGTKLTLVDDYYNYIISDQSKIRITKKESKDGNVQTYLQAIGGGEAVITFDYENNQLIWPVIVDGPQVTQIELSINKNPMAVNEIGQLAVKAIYSDGMELNASQWTEWKISDPELIQYSGINYKDGYAEFKALKSGHAVISGKFVDIEADINVEISSPQIFKSYYITPNIHSIPLESSIDFKLVGVDLEGGEHVIEPPIVGWLASSSTFFSLTEKGRVTAKMVGQAYISAKVKDLDPIQHLVKVIDAEPVEIEIYVNDEIENDERDLIETACGSENLDFRVIAKLTNGQVVDITQNDKAVFLVDKTQILSQVTGPLAQKGRYVTKTEGLASIIVQYQNSSAGINLKTSRQVQVGSGKIKEVRFVPEPSQVPIGKTFSINATTIDSCNKEVKIESGYSFTSITQLPEGLNLDFSGKTITTSGDINTPAILSLKGTYKFDNETYDDIFDIIIGVKRVDSVSIVTQSVNESGYSFAKAPINENVDFDVNATFSNNMIFTKDQLLDLGYSIAWTASDVGSIFSDVGEINANGIYTPMQMGTSQIKVEVTEPDGKNTVSANIRAVTFNNCTISQRIPGLDLSSFEMSYYGFCFYLGDAGQSCHSVCTAQGGLSYDEMATTEIIGSDQQGSSYCHNLGRMFKPDVSIVYNLLNIKSANIGEGYGCSINVTANLLLKVNNISTNPTDSSASIQRICGCK